jgi:hypothetical protein
MDRKKQERLQQAGFTVGDAKEFLNLTDDELKQVQQFEVTEKVYEACVSAGLDVSYDGDNRDAEIVLTARDGTLWVIRPRESAE